MALFHNLISSSYFYINLQINESVMKYEILN